MSVTTKNIKTVGKLISVLECFSTSDRALPAAEIARRVGLPRSTAHRAILALKEIGFLEQDQSRDKYRLGLKLFQLGITMLHNMDLQREARPFVEALSSLTGENIHLCVFDGERMVFAESARGGPTGAHNATITMELSPCYCTGVGKATLAFQSELTIEKVINAGLTAFTPNTIVDAQRLREELARIRARGYAIDNGEHSLAVRCVAAPIRNISGRVIGAISISGPTARMTDEHIREFTPYVVSHARAISRRLGCTLEAEPPPPPPSPAPARRAVRKKPAAARASGRRARRRDGPAVA